MTYLIVPIHRLNESLTSSLYIKEKKIGGVNVKVKKIFIKEFVFVFKNLLTKVLEILIKYF